MTPSKNVALAAGLVAAAASLAAAPAFAEPSSHQKKLAAIAADEAAFKRAQGQQGRHESAAARAERTRWEEFRKLCNIKPVMSDPEIDGCKRAYKL